MTSATSAPPSGYADLEVVGDRDVAVLPLPARQVVVDDRPHESLRELELASLR